jgi:hypothetical protein
MSVIPALGRLGWDDHDEFEDSYIVRSCLKKRESQWDRSWQAIWH